MAAGFIPLQPPPPPFPSPVRPPSFVPPLPAAGGTLSRQQSSIEGNGSKRRVSMRESNGRDDRCVEGDLPNKVLVSHSAFDIALERKERPED